MNHDARRSLEDLLDREIEVARSLAATLAAERSALVGDSPQAVQACAAQKIQLLSAIETIETERRALWDARLDGASGFAASLAASVAERWHALLSLIAGCRTANEVNGHIIHVRRNQIRQLIDIVRGGAPLTYGPQGKTRAPALRPLARA